MSSVTYHALWLAVALVAIGIASAIITRHLGMRESRRAAAEAVLDALARYSEWLAAQRRAIVHAGEPGGPRAPLAQAQALCSAWFPDLAAGMAHLTDVHRRLMEFLEAQHALRERDPEGWLESDHDGRFMALWREHRLAVHRLADRLRHAARPVIDPEPESIFPA